MNVFVEDDDLAELLNGSSKGKYKKLAKDKKFLTRLQDIYATMLEVVNVSELAIQSYLHYEKLVGNLKGYSSIRIMNGRVERLIFTEHDKGITIKLIEINQTHYDKKR